jgi:hypothetical protein
LNLREFLFETILNSENIRLLFTLLIPFVLYNNSWIFFKNLNFTSYFVYSLKEVLSDFIISFFNMMLFVKNQVNVNYQSNCHHQYHIKSKLNSFLFKNEWIFLHKILSISFKIKAFQMDTIFLCINFDCQSNDLNNDDFRNTIWCWVFQMASFISQFQNNDLIENNSFSLLFDMKVIVSVMLETY